MMFMTVLKAEFVKALKSPVFWIFLLILGFVSFQDSSNVVEGRRMINGFGLSAHNAPLFLARTFSMLSLVTVLLTIVLIGRSVVKDFEANVHSFFFASPLSKAAYLFGRFSGNLIATWLCFLGIVAGTLIGCSVIAPRFVTDFHGWSYGFGLLVILLPNLFFIGSTFFALATLTRNMLLTYLAGVGFLLLYGVVSSFTRDAENEFLKILVDPTGLAYLGFVSADWTAAEINANQIPMQLPFMLNRIGLVLISVVVLGIVYRRFALTERSEGGRLKHEKRMTGAVLVPAPDAGLTPVNRVFTATMEWRQFFHLVWRDARRILFHPAFILLTYASLQQMYRNFTANVGPGGSNIHALTSWFLRFADSIYGYMLPLTIFFGGMLVWKQRDEKTDSFYNSLPSASWIGYSSKLSVMVLVQFAYVVLVFLTGVFCQTVIFNQPDIEPALYAKRLLGIDLINYIHIAIIVFFFQVLVPNKFAGFLLCAIFYAGGLLLFNVFEVDHFWLHYGFLPPYQYSNLSGFGHYGTMLVAYRLYWIFISILIMIFTMLFWPVGSETSLKIRWKLAAHRFNPRYRLLAASSVLATVVMAGYIYYNESFLNKPLTDFIRNAERAQYEKKYKPFEQLPHPVITHVQLKVDLYPGKRDCYISGSYTVENRTQHQIDSFLVNLLDHYYSPPARLEVQGASLRFDFRSYGAHTAILEKPLMPGETSLITFSYLVKADGFSTRAAKDELSSNGSFIGNTPLFPAVFFPSIGYRWHQEISTERIRVELGLPRKTFAGLPSRQDSMALMRQMTDLVQYEAILSTDADQTAITNGDLIRHWSEGGRNYFHYRTDHPINSGLAIVSGRYEVEEEEYDGVKLQIFFDKKHSFNVQSMMKGMKASLDYGNKNFGKYPYKTLRIVEVNAVSYPGTGNALSLPTLFGWQENGGFISNLTDTTQRNVVFNTAVHEFGHQWWPHLVRSAFVEGSGVLTETMAQWVRLACMEKEFGKTTTLEFLSDEREDYLRGRKGDLRGEHPMVRANSGHLIYSKGSLAMYALKRYLSEDSVNKALRNLAELYGGLEEGPYPTTIELVAALRSVTPDSLQYVVTDWFENITLHDLELASAEVSANGKGEFSVSLSIRAEKLKADSLGNESPIPMNEYVAVRLLDKDGDFQDNWIKLIAGINRVTINCHEEIVEAVLDPDRILIDRNPDNNRKAITRNPLK